MNRFIFTIHAERLFSALDTKVQEQILQKLNGLKTHPNINAVLKHVSNIPPATHRLRMGNFRLLIKKEDQNCFLVLKVGHRKDIYR